LTVNRLVYDSALGGQSLCPRCGKRLDRCACAQQRAAPAASGPAASLPRDGVLRILRDRKHRGGKVVTLVAGVPGSPDAVAQLAAELKRLCGTGGTVKGDVVEIQGDHRERIAAVLRQRGYSVKLAGG
jgi:translation initiation factor 1